MVSDVMRAALEELQEMAEHAEQVHLMAVRFGVNQTTFAIVQAAAVRGVVEKALREVGMQLEIPLEPPMSETVRKP